MHPKTKKQIAQLLIVGCLLAVAGILLAATTFTRSTSSYYGREAAINKYTIVITSVPNTDPNDVNDVHSTATASEPVFGELKRITLNATGTDGNFAVRLLDEKGIVLFDKTDCNTSVLPVSYALTTADTAGNKYLGQFVAGNLTAESNDVNALSLTDITMSLYYRNERY